MRDGAQMTTGGKVAEPPAAAPGTVPDPVRGLDAGEVARFRRDGWVKVSQLISAQTAARLLDRAREMFADRSRMSVDGLTAVRRGEGGDPAGQPMWTQVKGAALEDPLFASISLSKTLGASMQRLHGREVPIRFWTDLIACKTPESQAGGSGVTGWHQDFPSAIPLDRSSIATAWIALDRVTPEQGSMRFMTGSHRAGLLGSILGFDGPDGIFQTYPFLRQEYAESDPITYEPGDATFHHGLMVHGAPPNRAATPRWSYITTLVTGDALYTGATGTSADGLGLTPWQPIDHPRFPAV